jgi:iron complex outermembrane receptor protein
MQPVNKNISPDVFGGLMSSFFWKGFSAYVGLDYKFGGSIFSYSNYYLTGLGETKNTLKYRDEAHGGIAYYEAGGKRIQCDHSLQKGQDGETVYHNGMILKGVKRNEDGTWSPNDIIANSTAYYQSYLSDMSDAFQPDALYKNDYIKLREVSIGYTLPKKWSEKAMMQKITVALNARNLFYLYKTLPNVDTESTLGTSGDAAYREQSFYPAIRTYGFSINVSF